MTISFSGLFPHRRLSGEGKDDERALTGYPFPVNLTLDSGATLLELLRGWGQRGGLTPLEIVNIGRNCRRALRGMRLTTFLGWPKCAAADRMS